jgi:hypothetical protein
MNIICYINIILHNKFFLHKIQLYYALLTLRFIGFNIHIKLCFLYFIRS